MTNEEREKIIANNVTLLERSFNNIKTNSKKDVPYVITYKGNVVKLRSGKSVWRRIGDVKNALTSHLKYSLWTISYLNISYEDRRKLREEICKTIMKDIKFVPYKD